MVFSSLLLILVLISPSQDEPRELVAKLVAPKSAERASAESRLEALGEAAIPALIEATDSVDLELRHRAASFLDRLEGRRLTRPTLVPLDFKTKPLREVADAIGRSAGVTIMLEPDADPRIRDKSVTLQTEQPIPLWNAIDRLSVAAGLKLEPPVSPWLRQRQMLAMGGNPQPLRGRGASGMELVLRPDESGQPVPTSDSGAFRVSVANLVFDRTKNFLRTQENQGKPESTTQFIISLQVRAEPRLTIASVEDSHLIEATDDKGQSLLMPATANTVATPNGVTPRSSMRFMQEMNNNPPLTFQLKYPEVPGRLISRFRGTMRGLVIGRRSDPLVIPLNNPTGKTFSAGSTSLTVQSFQVGAPGRETTFEFTFDGLGGGSGGQPMFNTLDPRSGLRPPPSAMGQIEFLDAKGRVCHVAELGGFNGAFNAWNQRKILFITPPMYGSPVEARYYGAVWSTVEIGFDFRDIPMP